MGADAADTAPDTPRIAGPQDLQLLKTRYAVVGQELNRMGLRATLGKTCKTFVTADSVRPIETPLPLDGGTVTLPCASFLVWSEDRPHADALLYHVFGRAETAYTQSLKLSQGATPAKTAYEIGLAKREPYPTTTDLLQRHATFAGPFSDLGTKGGSKVLAVRPYTLPTQNDDPASVLPRKAERVLQVTCLTDPDRMTNCLCAGTD